MRISPQQDPVGARRILVRHRPAANTIAEATQAADPERRHVLTGFVAHYSDGASGFASVQIDGTEQFQVPFHAANPTIELPFPLVTAKNQAVSVEVPAAGVGITGESVIFGWTE